MSVMTLILAIILYACLIAVFLFVAPLLNTTGVYVCVGIYTVLVGMTQMGETPDLAFVLVATYSEGVLLCIVMANMFFRKKYNHLYRRYLDDHIMSTVRPPEKEDLLRMKCMKNGVTMDIVLPIGSEIERTQLVEMWLSEQRRKAYKPYEWYVLLKSGELDKYISPEDQQ